MLTGGAGAGAAPPPLPPAMPAAPPMSDWRGQLRLFRSRLIMSELSGALGDLGTFIPIVVALSIQYPLSFPATLVLAGLANVLTGF
eukprot:SAG22_NODE_12236_length_451_cov_0.588068_1_plen_85_part_01